MAIFLAAVGVGCAVCDRGAARRRASPANAARAGMPNIVLITTDTVRADHLPLYGYQRNTVPRLAAFAAGATLYRHTAAQSPT